MSQPRQIQVKAGPRVFGAIFAVLAALIGMAFVLAGWMRPENFDLSEASAVQITQVYSQASFEILVGIAFLILAMLGAIIYFGSGLTQRLAEQPTEYQPSGYQPNIVIK